MCLNLKCHGGGPYSHYDQVLNSVSATDQAILDAHEHS